MSRYLFVILPILLVLAGCTTLRETQPTQTAREQLLLSTAADRASAEIDPKLPAGSRIYVDTSSFGSGEEYQNLYAVNAIKNALLKHGYALAASEDDADTIAAVSSGALSIDNTQHLVGIPSTTVPIPLAGGLDTPEIALYKSEIRTGVAKFLITFYNAHSGRFEDGGEPVYGFSHFNRYTAFFYGWRRSNLYPQDVEKQSQETDDQ